MVGGRKVSWEEHQEGIVGEAAGAWLP